MPQFSMPRTLNPGITLAFAIQEGKDEIVWKRRGLLDSASFCRDVRLDRLGRGGRRLFDASSL
jgi:hypothetical protein